MKVELTLIVGPDQLVSGVAGEVPGVAESEAVPGPLDHPDLVLHAARQSHLVRGNRNNQSECLEFQNKKLSQPNLRRMNSEDELAV